MAYAVLARKGKVLIQKSVWGIPDKDLAQASIKDKLDTFDVGVKAAYDHRWPLTNTVEGDILDSSKDGVQEPYENEDPSLEIYDFTHKQMDEYLSKELNLPCGGELVTARVIKRSELFRTPP
jgi:hypothetical protein